MKNGAPEPDKIQDIEIISSTENGTHTTMTFSRKLETEDQKDMTITVSKKDSHFVICNLSYVWITTTPSSSMYNLSP